MLQGLHHSTAPDLVAVDKFLPPRGPARVLARERLLTQLFESRHKRCLVLQGPAGCGKSTTLVAWRQALLGLNFDVAWLTLTEDDNEPGRWLDSLLASLEQTDPAITREAALLAGRATNTEAVECAVISLLHGIAAHQRDVTLVLDDFHHLTSARIHEALQWLLDYAPPNFHLVLLSRAAVPLSLARLRDQGLVLELDQRDLRFTLPESEQFLNAQLDHISPRDARTLHELTDGWVAGLHLFAAHWKRRKQATGGASLADSMVRAHVQNAGAFTQYFEREVLSRLSPSETALLIRVASSDRFCTALCAALTEPPQPLAEVAALLARLECDNLFIVPVEGAEPGSWYRLHPLLRETLLERFHAWSEIQQRQVHVAAWHWFRAHGHIEEAVRHAVLGGEADAAADLVLQSARNLFSRGELRRVVQLVRLLPPEQIQARIGLRLWKLRMQLYAREFDAAAAAMDRLQAEIPSDDTESRVTLTVLRGVMALQRDDTDAAMSILPELLQASSHDDAIVTGTRRALLSWLYMHRGEYERARSFQCDQPPLLLDGTPLTGSTAGSLSGRSLMGFSYALEGQMLQVERISRDVLREAEQQSKLCSEAAYFSAALLADVLYEHNDAAGAIRLLEERVDVLERVSIPDSVLKVLATLSAAHWACGHPLDAFAYLDRLEDYATQLGLDRLLAHALAARVSRHLSGGELDAADACLARLDAIDARYDQPGPSALDEIRAVTQQAHIRRCIAHEDFHGAHIRLTSLITRCEARGWQRQVAQLRLQNALVESRRERPDAAREEALAALRLGHRLGLVRSLLDADPAAMPLIARLLQDMSQQQQDPVLSFYVARLQAAQQASSAALAAAGDRQGALRLPALDLSEREADVLRLLAQTMPNKKIARALGLSPETVKWHLKKIYGKLGVTTRDEAVARARHLELDLGSPAGAPQP
ncbi:LuxR C-terminal-related transcriptional regulator [Cupriavidus sp. CP313]